MARNDRVEKYKDLDLLSSELFKRVYDIASKCISERGWFALAVSGGSLPAIFCKGLKSAPFKVDLSKWIILFADERFVPLNDPESNYNTFATAAKPLTFQNYINIDAELPSSELAAEDYTAKVLKVFSDKKLLFNKDNHIPKIDLVLLGMGPDGHTCSLFPNHKLLNENNLLFASIDDSPKPPKSRITMTFKLLEQSSNIMFVVTGEAKKKVLQEILKNNDQSYPSGRVTLESGEAIIWFLDEAASALL